ncbi:tripartite ATP-independent transporter DctM subunit [Bradyrhizobium japonicum]
MTDPHVASHEQEVTGRPSTGLLSRINAVVARLGMYLSVTGLLVIVTIVFYQVFGRYVLNSSPTWTENLALVLILYVTLIGAAVGVRDAGHIGMDSLLVMLPDHLREKIELVIHVLVAVFGIAMAYNGWILGASVGTVKIPNLGLPEVIRYVPLIASGVLIVSFSIEHIIAPPARRGGRPLMELIILGATFFGFLILGVPVAFAIGLSAICTILYEGLPVAVIFQQMMSGMNIFSFLAIPFFVFSGELMLHGGVADKIVQLAKNLVGHIRGGLGMSNVVACTLFGGVSGSPVADVSAMGAVMIPMMKKEGFDTDYAVNVTTHASLVGALMPTSHNMIIYALAAGGKVSIGALIAAGLLPALVLMVCMLVAAYAVAVKRGYPAGKFPGWAEVFRSFAAALPGLLIVGIILAGILSGVFTATESAAVAVTYTILLTFFIYRTMTLPNFLRAAAKAVKTTGVVLLLIGVSTMFQYLMGLYEVADFAGDLMSKVSSQPWVIFLLINVILFVLGTFMDMAATILICTPIFLPIAMKAGMDPVQFGMLMLINCALGLNTPPVGTTQFVGCAIGGISVGAVMRTILPFYAALIAALMFVTYVPAFSLWLPRLLMGYKG